MFDHFTFGAQPQTRHLQQDEVAASPTDTSFISEQHEDSIASLPTQHLTPGVPAINDIVSQFTTYTLLPEDLPGSSSRHNAAQHSTICVDTQSRPTFAANENPFTAVEMSFISTRRGLTHVRSTPASVPSTSTTSHPSSTVTHVGDVGCRRLQRQINTQLQSCTKHVKDISSLVEDMISSESQCVLHPAPTNSYPSSQQKGEIIVPDSNYPKLEADDDIFDEDTEEDLPPYPTTAPEVNLDEDEGFAEMDEDEVLNEDIEISLRRASAPNGIRKYADYTPTSFANYKSTLSSGKGIGSNQNLYMPREKHKIRCIPRMRRRKKEPSSNV